MNPAHGFTLVELLFAMSVLAVLGVYTGTDIQHRTTKSRVDATANSMFALRGAALGYYDHHRSWPGSLDRLGDWLGEQITVRPGNPFGFAYTLGVPESTATGNTHSLLQIGARTGSPEQALALARLLGTWAMARHDTTYLGVLPPDRGLSSGNEPYRLDHDLLMDGHAIDNLGHIRLAGDGKDTTLIVDRIFVYNFVTDHLYTHNFLERRLGWYWQPLQGELDDLYILGGGLYRY